MIKNMDLNFNPRSREGSDNNAIDLVITKGIFQSTLPRRERLCRVIPIVSFNLFQSTLPRRERQDKNIPGNQPGHISIHAPAKGATHSGNPSGRDKRHFNPRSREGSDQGTKMDKQSCSNFNPRSREGSDSLH